MKKTIALALCVALALSLCLSAGAVGNNAAVEEKFSAVNTYPGYTDVTETDWFYDNAKLCYEIGLMTGTDVGFEPTKVLTTGECVTLAARVKAALREETIPAATPGEAWWTPYNSYLFSGPSEHGVNSGDDYASRSQFLSMLYGAIDGYESSLLAAINDVKALPDPDLANVVVVLQFYNAGILTGTDKYGTFAGTKSLTRAEAAAMVSRIVRPALRLSFIPADCSPFTAARLSPDEEMFTTGLTADQYLTAVNDAIATWEDTLGSDFNWHTDTGDGKTVLEHVKDDSLTALGIDPSPKNIRNLQTFAYENFDVQVYYSRLIDLIGGTL